MGHEGMQTSCNRRDYPPAPGSALGKHIASCRVRLRVRRRPLIRETREGASAFLNIPSTIGGTLHIEKSHESFERIYERIYDTCWRYYRELEHSLA